MSRGNLIEPLPVVTSAPSAIRAVVSLSAMMIEPVPAKPVLVPEPVAKLNDTSRKSVSARTVNVSECTRASERISAMTTFLKLVINRLPPTPLSPLITPPCRIFSLGSCWESCQPSLLSGSLLWRISRHPVHPSQRQAANGQPRGSCQIHSHTGKALQLDLRRIARNDMHPIPAAVDQPRDRASRASRENNFFTFLKVFGRSK